MSQFQCRYMTVATRSHLPQVAVLANSLIENKTETRLTCYLVESMEEEGDNWGGLFDVVTVNDLNLPDARGLLFRYGPMSACCALKPHAIQHELGTYPTADAVVFLDADTRCYQTIDTVIAEVLDGHSIALSPHLLTTARPLDYPIIMRAGIYNAGFLAVRNDNEACDMLRWWAERLEWDCIEDPYGGIHWEQRWLDMVPVLFPGATVVRHPGINVGYWNLHEKTLTIEDGQVYVGDGQPLCLFHFSGLSATRLSSFQSEEHENTMGGHVAESLADDYRHELSSKQDRAMRGGEYSFGRFDDGTLIEPSMREVVRQKLVETNNPFGDKQKVVFCLSYEEPKLFINRATYRVEHGQDLALKLEHLWNHPVVGLVWKAWRRWVNQDL